MNVIFKASIFGVQFSKLCDALLAYFCGYTGKRCRVGIIFVLSVLTSSKAVILFWMIFHFIF